MWGIRNINRIIIGLIRTGVENILFYNFFFFYYILIHFYVCSVFAALGKMRCMTWYEILTIWLLYACDIVVVCYDERIWLYDNMLYEEYFYWLYIIFLCGYPLLCLFYYIYDTNYFIIPFYFTPNYLFFTIFYHFWLFLLIFDYFITF